MSTTVGRHEAPSEHPTPQPLILRQDFSASDRLFRGTVRAAGIFALVLLFAIGSLPPLARAAGLPEGRIQFLHHLGISDPREQTCLRGTGLPGRHHRSRNRRHRGRRTHRDRDSALPQRVRTDLEPANADRDRGSGGGHSEHHLRTLGRLRVPTQHGGGRARGSRATWRSFPSSGSTAHHSVPLCSSPDSWSGSWSCRSWRPSAARSSPSLRPANVKRRSHSVPAVGR